MLWQKVLVKEGPITHNSQDNLLILYLKKLAMRSDMSFLCVKCDFDQCNSTLCCPTSLTAEKYYFDSRIQVMLCCDKIALWYRSSILINKIVK